VLRRASKLHRVERTVGRSSSAILQPALRVGAANDPLEREAETMAERVVAMPAPRMETADAAGDGAAPGADAQRASIDDQPSTDELETVPAVPEDHLDPEVPPQEDVSAEALTAADMQEIETGQPVDTGGDPPAEGPAAPAADEDVAQAARGDGASVGAEGGAAPPDVARRVAQPGSGRPLPQSVRAFMEPRFGRDFSSVRLHDGPEDRSAAHRIGARAFTHGHDIWIGPGESAGDRKLLAHELTHVVQQTSPGPARPLSRASETEPTEEKGEPQVRRGYIRNKAEKYARNVPGYRLICVIIGKSPITGDVVERNAINLLGAMMSLFPGGNLLFERLQEARVIEEAFEWVSSRLDALNITWTRIKGLISDLLDYLPDWPGDVVDYAIKLFKPLVDDLLTFIGEVVVKILEFIVRGALRLAGPWGEKIWAIIERAGAILGMILKDPLGFAKNLFAAVTKGFSQFGGNVLTHIKKGLLGWLFGTIKDLDIEMPERLDFKGLISIGLQVVGLTYANFRKLLVKRLEPNGDRKVSYIEKSVEAVKILAKEGFVGLWQRTLEMIDNFKETIVGGIQKFVTEQLIMGGISWLAGLSNPVGAIVKVVLAIYNIIKTFLERLDQILAVAESIFSSIGAIAAGRIKEAADYVERTIASTIPVVISFLAALVPVTGITNAIRNIIAKLQGAVQRAIDRMLTFVVQKGKKLLSKLIGKLNKKRKLPSANFTFGEKEHRIYAEQVGKKIEVRIASEKGATPEEVAAASAAEAKKLENPKAMAEAADISSEAGEAGKETEEKAKTLQPESQKDNQLKGFAALEAELKEAAAELQAAGVDTANYPEIDTKQAQYLFRAKEPRFTEIEGGSDEYSALGKITSQTIKIDGKEDPAKRRYSDFYENDHIPEKQFPKAILESISLFKPGGTDGEEVDRDSEKAEAPPAQKEASKPKIGQIGDTITKIAKDGAGLPALSIYRPVHILKKSTPPDELTATVKKATQAPDPVGAIKMALSKEIKLEADKIVEILRKDASASDAIRGGVDAGITKLIASNSALYALDKVDEPQKAAAPGATPDASLSKLPLGGSEERGIPNFLSQEGAYRPHGSFDSGFGKYMEYDHVIDAAWPLQTGQLGFGHPTLRALLDPRLKAAGLDMTNKQVKGRIGNLGGKNIFLASQGMAAYTSKTGHAIALYRPVHRAVTRALAKGAKSPSDPSVPAAAVTDSFVEPLIEYIKTGDLAALETARGKVQADLKKLLEEKTDSHIDLIADQYVHELRAVKTINKPPMEAKAQQAMVQISGTVRSGLQQARANTKALF
jgi:Domain of unknown function (DUF4157)